MPCTVRLNFCCCHFLSFSVNFLVILVLVSCDISSRAGDRVHHPGPCAAAAPDLPERGVRPDAGLLAARAPHETQHQGDPRPAPEPGQGLAGLPGHTGMNYGPCVCVCARLACVCMCAWSCEWTLLYRMWSYHQTLTGNLQNVSSPISAPLCISAPFRPSCPQKTFTESILTLGKKKHLPLSNAFKWLGLRINEAWLAGQRIWRLPSPCRYSPNEGKISGSFCL